MGFFSDMSFPRIDHLVIFGTIHFLLKKGWSNFQPQELSANAATMFFCTRAAPIDHLSSEPSSSSSKMAAKLLPSFSAFVPCSTFGVVDAFASSCFCKHFMLKSLRSCNDDTKLFVIFARGKKTGKLHTSFQTHFLGPFQPSAQESRLDTYLSRPSRRCHFHHQTNNSPGSFWSTCTQLYHQLGRTDQILLALPLQVSFQVSFLLLSSAPQAWKQAW